MPDETGSNLKEKALLPILSESDSQVESEDGDNSQMGDCDFAVYCVQDGFNPVRLKRAMLTSEQLILNQANCAWDVLLFSLKIIIS